MCLMMFWCTDYMDNNQKRSRLNMGCKMHWFGLYDGWTIWSEYIPINHMQFDTVNGFVRIPDKTQFVVADECEDCLVSQQLTQWILCLCLDFILIHNAAAKRLLSYFLNFTIKWTWLVPDLNINIFRNNRINNDIQWIQCMQNQNSFRIKMKTYGTSTWARIRSWINLCSSCKSRKDSLSGHLDKFKIYN